MLKKQTEMLHMKALRMWRQYIPKRLSEVIAVLSVTATFFLFIHTTSLNSRLKEIQQQQGSYGSLGRTGEGISEEGDVASGAERHQKREAFSFPASNVKISAKELNNTANADKELLFFNRVPKVGSQTTMHLLNILSRKNHFFFHKDKPNRVEAIKLSDREEKRLTALIDTFRTPAVYIKHVCFCNFTKYGFRQPIYVNMVRDPVERVISWYYYIRAPWYFVERKRNFPELPLPDPRWLRKDYETCVQSHDKECQYLDGEVRDDYGQLTEFFCGQNDECTGFNEDFPLQQAKQNVEKNYAVVGILEDMNKTLTVLEHYIPRFFKGVKDIYYEEIAQFTKLNRNIYKPSVEKKVKDIVRLNFTRELEFYEFCRQRLHLQYQALNLV